MNKTGLALGGGVVLGAAHVGILKAIDEFDIKIDMISGTSIGAFVAALYAFGKNSQEIMQLASELKWFDITGISLSRYGLLSNEKLGSLILEHIGDKDIMDSNIPLFMIATDITNGEKVILDKGPVASAVMASTCIPGIFKPVEIDGKILVDGGIVENVPVISLRKMGADPVIGVDLNHWHTYGKPQHIFDVILNSFHFLIRETTRLQTETADFMINPNLAEFNRTDTSQVEELIERGYQDSIKVLDKIRSSK